MKLNYTKNLSLCIYLTINSFLAFSKFQSLYFYIHVFSTKHKLHLPCKSWTRLIAFHIALIPLGKV